MQAQEFTFEDDEDYRIPHRAPMHDSGSPLYDLTDTYPDDIYGPNGVQYYGTREPWDARSIRVIQLSRNKPNQTIQIFRAVPKEVKSNTINPGDWVTASREYATQHGKGLGKYKLLSKIVPAKTLFTNGDSIHEWGYDPGGAAQPVAEGSVDPTQQDLTDVADWMNTTSDKIKVVVKQEPIEKFLQQIREMYSTYDEFPKDAKRTNRIVSLLKKGEKPLPIYVEANDPHLFAMEGRHRMVAFWLAGMKTIPVAYVYRQNDKKQGVAEGSPNFNREWDEATRYPEFVNLGKEKWIELVSKGKQVTVTRKNVNKINNTDAADPKSFKLLDTEKQKRALAQLANGDVEMPIVARYSDGYLELIGGNTRLTAQMAKDGQAKVWLFNVPEELTQGVAEGSLNEIYKMPPTKDSSQGMTTWAYNDAVEKKSPVLYRDSNVIIFKANEDLLRYIILQDGNPVLYIGLSKFLDGYKSGTVATEIAGRGKGLAQKAYLNASDILGVPIYSDTTQTDASRLGIWDKLIQQYPDRIVGYDQKTNKNLPLSLTDTGPMLNKNQPIYVDRNKKDTKKPIAPNQKYRTRVLKLLPTKQGVAEDNASPTKISFKVKKGRGRFATEMIVNGQQAGVYQYDANTGRSIAEVFPEFRSQGLGKILVLHAIYTAAKLGLDFQEDESRTAAYDNVLDSLSSNGYIVDDDGYWYVTGEGEQYLQQSLKNKAPPVAEDTGSYIPPVLYHATYKQRLKSIQLKGLGAASKRNWTDSKRGVVYLALDPDVAESYAETALDDLDADWDIVILKISTSGLDTNKFQLDRNVLDNEGDTLEYHGIIPPGNISLYKQGG